MNFVYVALYIIFVSYNDQYKLVLVNACKRQFIISSYRLSFLVATFYSIQQLTDWYEKSVYVNEKF